ncbi:MAG: amidohydrolase, partial [Oceanibaculum nanhaiense]|nr:amidohydrolase [Oceanibaculum nanhaiense]
RIANEDVAAFCREQGPRFVGFAGVDPNKGMTAVRELDHAVRELGLRGLNLQCFEHKLAINDKKMYPLYAKCIELDIPVNLHCSINFATSTLMEFGRPALLDEVMVHFPELRVCAAPPGFPWVHELIGVAWRHANVHIGLVAVRPKYLTVAGSGYEPLLQYGRTILQDRIIFGSAYPLMPLERTVREIEALPLEEDVRRKWLYGNAKRFLRL